MTGLLEPITAERPCGESLDDTPVLSAFDQFRLFGRQTPLRADARGFEARQSADGSSSALRFSWDEVRESAERALSSSKDIRPLSYLAVAGLWKDGVSAFVEGLAAAADWLDHYWDGAYPLVDEDPVLRSNALNCFADPWAVLDGLRRTPLTESAQHGRFSLRDTEIAAGRFPPGPGDVAATEEQISAAFADTSLEWLQRIQRSLAAGRAAAHRIVTVTRERGGEDAVPNLDDLSSVLAALDRLLGSRLVERVGVADARDDHAGAAPSPVAAAGPSIRSREEAIRALEAVAAYFRQTEPSSPVPLFIDRAKRLVSKDFLGVLADVAPEALGQARAAGGLRDGE